MNQRMINHWEINSIIIINGVHQQLYRDSKRDIIEMTIVIMIGMIIGIVMG